MVVGRGLLRAHLVGRVEGLHDKSNLLTPQHSPPTPTEVQNDMNCSLNSLTGAICRGA